MEFGETAWFRAASDALPATPVHDGGGDAGAAGVGGPAPTHDTELGSRPATALSGGALGPAADGTPRGLRALGPSDNRSPYDADGGRMVGAYGASMVDADGESPFDADVESIATSLGILRRLGGRRAAARSAALRMREYAVAEVVDLVASRGYSSPGEVAATLGLAQSRASVLVRRAREARWLDAERGPWDARVTVVSVTDEGREIVELMQADRCITVDRATVLWSDEDRATLAHLLGRFAEAVERPFRR